MAAIGTLQIHCKWKLQYERALGGEARLVVVVLRV
jgi:hypothetical protein